MQNPLSFMSGISKLHKVLFFVLELPAKDKRKERKQKDFHADTLDFRSPINHMSHNGETFLIARTMR